MNLDPIVSIYAAEPDDKYLETGLPYLPLQMTPQRWALGTLHGNSLICFHCTSTEATPTLQGLLSLGDSIPRGLRNDDWSWGNLSNNSSYIQQSSEQLWKTCRNLLKTLKTPWNALALKARQDVWQILNKGRLLMENWCLLPAKHRVMQNAQCTDLCLSPNGSKKVTRCDTNYSGHDSYRGR